MLYQLSSINYSSSDFFLDDDQIRSLCEAFPIFPTDTLQQKIEITGLKNIYIFFFLWKQNSEFNLISHTCLVFIIYTIPENKWNKEYLKAKPFINTVGGRERIYVFIFLLEIQQVLGVCVYE